MECLTCKRDEFEKRGQRRVYGILDEVYEVDGWDEGDEIEWDLDDKGREVIYCRRCDSEMVLVGDELSWAEYEPRPVTIDQPGWLQPVGVVAEDGRLEVCGHVGGEGYCTLRVGHVGWHTDGDERWNR